YTLCSLSDGRTISMSESGHSRRFGRTTATSGLPRRTDIPRIGGHVSKVPKGDLSKREVHYVSQIVSKNCRPKCPGSAVQHHQQATYHCCREDSINGSSDPTTQIVVREDNADNPDGHFPSRYSKWFKSEGYRPRSRYGAQNCQSPKAACVIPNDPCCRIGLLQSYNLRHNH